MAEVFTKSGLTTVTATETKAIAKVYDIAMIVEQKRCLLLTIKQQQDEVDRIDVILAEAEKLGIKPSIKEELLT